jgi:hypothetical protein
MGILSKVSVIFSFALIISSCATNRIQVSRTDNHFSNIRSAQLKRKDIICKTPNPRQSSYRKKGVLSLRSNNRQSVKLAFNKVRNTITNSSYKNRRINDNYAGKEKFISDLGSLPVNRVLPDDIKKAVLILTQEPDNESVDKLHLIPLNYVTPTPSLASLTSETPQITFVKKPPKEADTPLLAPAKPNQSQRQNLPRNEIAVYLMILLAGLFSVIGLKRAPYFTRNMSLWATMNPWKTKFIFTGIHIVTGIAGIILGAKLADQGTHFSDLSGYFLPATFLTSALFYPVRNSSIKLFEHSYLRQKMHDLVLVLSGFALMVNLGNNYSSKLSSRTNIDTSDNNKQLKEYVLLNNHQVPGQRLLYEDNKQAQDQTVAPQKRGLSLGMRILLTVLSILVFAFLALVLFALSCSIACSGSEGLAWVVGIGGFALLCALLIWTLRSINIPKYKRVSKPIIT